MTVIYIILAVILVLVLLITTILLLPLSVRISYKDELVAYAGVSFVKFRIFPKTEKKKRIRKDKKNKPIKKTTLTDEQASLHSPTGGKVATTKTSNNVSGNEEKKSVKDTLSLILEIVKSVFEVMGKRATIEIDTLKVVVSRPDAADTAVYYALCQGLVSTLLALTSEFSQSKINDKNVSVAPDFITGKSNLEADISLSVPAGSLLVSIMKGYFRNQFR